MTRTARYFLAGAAIAITAGAPSLTSAQTAGYRLEPSGRATTVVTLNRAVPQGTPAAERPAPARIVIDYGQPHLRGRDVMPLVPQGQVWRLGANTSTTFTTDLDLVVGGQSVPKGSYTLWLQREANGAKLIVNKQTGQWGTSYDGTQDLVRVDLKGRTLHQPLEALQIALVPSGSGPNGTLRIVWGTLEYETTWSVKQ